MSDYEKNENRILGIIPARGGSQGVFDKNIKELCGLPLIGHIFKSACESKMLTDLILSTNDQRIADVGRRLGMNVPFLRPEEYATSTAKSVDVVKHAIGKMEKQNGYSYDYGVLLQPTCPLTQTHHIDDSVRLLIYDGYNSVVSLTTVDHCHPYFMMRKQGDSYESLLQNTEEYTNRQDLPEVYVRCGNVYSFERNLVMEHNKLFGYKTGYIIVEKEFSINIDDPIDWLIAETLVSRYGKQKIKE